MRLGQMGPCCELSPKSPVELESESQLVSAHPWDLGMILENKTRLVLDAVH